MYDRANGLPLQKSPASLVHHDTMIGLDPQVASEIGSNVVTLPDSVYAAYQNRCLRLDPATGETKGQFTLPELEGYAPPQEMISSTYIFSNH